MFFQTNVPKLTAEQEMLMFGCFVVLLAIIIQIASKIKLKIKGIIHSLKKGTERLEPSQNKSHLAEEQEHKRALIDLNLKRDEHKYKEKITKLKHSFATQERKNKLKEKEMDHAHETQLDSQKKIFEIISGLTSKVEVTDLKEVAYAATILHSIQVGKSVDPEVLDVVSSKVSNPALANELNEVSKICELEQSNKVCALEFVENPIESICTN